MKTSIIKLGSLIFMTLFLLSSCNKNPIFKTSADKIQGEWKYEKVKFRKSNGILNKDVIDDFKDLIIEFDSEFNMTQTNTSDGTVKIGIWNIDRDKTNDDNSSQELIGALSNIGTSVVELVNWENLSVSKQKIRCTEQKNDGTFTYTLIRN